MGIPGSKNGATSVPYFWPYFVIFTYLGLKNRPYIWNRYLHFRILNFPLILWGLPMKDVDLSNVSAGVMGIFWGYNEYLLIILTREITGFFWDPDFWGHPDVSGRSYLISWPVVWEPAEPVNLMFTWTLSLQRDSCRDFLQAYLILSRVSSIFLRFRRKVMDENYPTGKKIVSEFQILNQTTTSWDSHAHVSTIPRRLTRRLLAFYVKCT